MLSKVFCTEQPRSSDFYHKHATRKRTALTPTAISLTEVIMSGRSVDGDWAPELRRFEEFPPEMKTLIMGYIAPLDRIVITTKRLRVKALKNEWEPIRFASRLMMAFSSVSSLPLYLRALRVNVKDYDFANVQAVLSKIQQSRGIAALQKFSFVTPAQVHYDSPELVGPNFHLNLRFGPGFTLDSQGKMGSYLRFIQQLQKKCGPNKHLRIFYKVTEAVGSLALNAMIGSTNFNEILQGQIRFLMAALRMYLAVRTTQDTGTLIQGGLGGGYDLNAGLRVHNVEEDAYWLGEMVWLQGDDGEGEQEEDEEYGY
ncbi:hypothetical protein LTR53_011214 [Teratosphaeriaceae sp. CCFEE 6253]|nr:hypothetical protein LTR53_011214 [Teratosphaeriaceae sp. CCFEE 6253]